MIFEYLSHPGLNILEKSSFKYGIYSSHTKSLFNKFHFDSVKEDECKVTRAGERVGNSE